jgi:hypothetical protein
MNEMNRPPVEGEPVIHRTDALRPDIPEAPPKPAAAQPPERPEDTVDFGEDEDRELTPEEIERKEAMEDPLAYPLSRPIQAHGEEIKILRWREPTGADIEKAGNPISIEVIPDTGRYRVAFDEKKMAAMICQLASIPPHSVRSLRAGDWTAIATKIFRFFA